MGRVVAVVGGGISGLGAARVLAGAAPTGGRAGHAESLSGGARPGGATGDVEVVVLEAEDRFGGKILSGGFRGRPVDFGPDNFLTRNPSAAELCDLLGIGDDLLAPATSSASVVSRGRLHPMPAGLILGLPPDLLALARSRIVSVRGLARAAFDLLPVGGPISPSSLGLAENRGAYGLPADDDRPEWSAGSILRRRLGREVVDRLVDPLLGGINAGGVDQLSLAVVAPQVAQALAGQTSITRALGRLAKRTPAKSLKDASSRPFFLGLRGGLGRIVDELVADLQGRGVKLHSGTPVTALRRSGDRFELDTPGATVVADGVVLAAPAYVVARPARRARPGRGRGARLDPPLGRRPGDPRLGRRPRARSSARKRVPRAALRRADRHGLHVHVRQVAADGAPGEVVLRASTGRYGDDRSASMPDEELVETVLGELRELLGVTAPPLESLVQRWPRAFPQYLPGHLRKIERALAGLRELPGLELAGPCLGGIGIPACLTSGERAAVEVLDRLSA